MSKTIKRIVLRMQKKIPAQASLSQKGLHNVYLHDLSTKGFSFYVKKDTVVSDSFKMQFRLGLFAKKIKCEVEVKNREETNGWERIGCAFIKLSEQDKERIGCYLGRYMNLYLPHLILNLATFLLVVDASLRILAYLVNFYYSATAFAKDSGPAEGTGLYGMIIALYVLNVYAAFMFTDRIIRKENKKDFFLSVLCLLPAFLYILVKNILYWKIGLWQDAHLAIRVFLGIQTFLILFTGYSLWRGVALLRRIDVVFDSIDAHRHKEG